MHEGNNVVCPAIGRLNYMEIYEGSPSALRVDSVSILYVCLLLALYRMPHDYNSYANVVTMTQYSCMCGPLIVQVMYCHVTLSILIIRVILSVVLHKQRLPISLGL